MRMITVFLGSLFALMLTSARAQEACMSTDPPNCSVYNDCIDVNCKCASTEFTYPATFGPKYCARFQQNERFSHAGRAWREKTLACLVDQASRAYAAQRPPQCNCQALEAQMIDSHTTCYVQSPSFCDLPDGDIRVVARIVDAKDFLSLGIAGVREVGRTLVACASQKQLERAVTITRVFVGETLTEGTEDARNYARGVLDEAANAAAKARLKDYEKASQGTARPTAASTRLALVVTRRSQRFGPSNGQCVQSRISSRPFFNVFAPCPPRARLSVLAEHGWSAVDV